MSAGIYTPDIIFMAIHAERWAWANYCFIISIRALQEFELYKNTPLSIVSVHESISIVSDTTNLKLKLSFALDTKESLS